MSDKPRASNNASDDYTPDKHLTPVLERASNEDLDLLVSCIDDTSGSCLLHSFSASHNGADHSMYYVQGIEQKILDLGSIVTYDPFGSNSFAKPTYVEIACSVAKKIGAEYSRGSTAEEFEIAIANIMPATVSRVIPFLVAATKNWQRNIPQTGVLVQSLGVSGQGLDMTLYDQLQMLYDTAGFVPIKMANVAQPALYATINAANIVAGIILWREKLLRDAGLDAIRLEANLQNPFDPYDISIPAYLDTLLSVTQVAMLRQLQKSDSLHQG